MKKIINLEKSYFYLLIICSIGIGLQSIIYKFAIIALLLQWLFSSNFSIKFQKFKQNKFAILLITFYAFYAISFFWSDNISVALTDLLLKTPIFIFPLVIASQEKLSSKEINIILLSFVISSFAVNISAFVLAIFNYLETGNVNVFYYHRLTFNMHSAYQAMFTCFSIAILIYLRIREKFIANWLMYVGVTIQLLFLLLLSSRMQIIIMIVLIPSFLLFYYYKQKKLYLGVVYIIIIFGIAKLIMSAPSSLNYRYNQTVSHINSIGVDNDNSDPRKFIWDEGLKAIRGNWLLGVGAGDLKEVLVDRYKLNILENPTSKLLMDSTINSLEANSKLVEHLINESLRTETSYDYQLNQYAEKSLERRNNRYKSFVRRGYNFHNQYLQVFGTIGVFGLLLLLYLFAIPFFLFIRQSNYLSASFLFIVGSSFMTESMLERQAGVSFIAFFFMLLIASKHQNKPS